MSEPFVGEIRMFAGNFAPRSWALCDGQLLAISQNNALFSLLGTTFGGDGRTTFGLPDARGRVPVHAGTGPGLTNRRLGFKGGSETASVNATQMGPHTHTWNGTGLSAGSRTPVGNVPAIAQGDVYTPVRQTVDFSPSALADTGGSQPHDNLHPYLCVNFIIALSGVYPSRS